MAKPLIGITCGSSRNDAKARTEQDRLNSAYSRAIWEAGGIPVILPILEDSAGFEFLERIDGLLLSGGADIDPLLYGEDPQADNLEIDRARDMAEIPLAREAVKRDLPVLGICRGIQTLNVALGGTLIQDLPGHRQWGSRSARTQEIEVRPNSRLSQMVEAERVAVNSLHHQALNRIAEPLEVSARAADGIAEAVEIPGARFVMGVQFHPEELTADSEEARRLFAAFVEAAKA